MSLAETIALKVPVIEKVTPEIQQGIPGWKELIGKSFLSRQYLLLLKSRCERLGFVAL